MRGCGQALGEVLKALGYKEAVVALYAGYPFGEYSKDREPTFGARARQQHGLSSNKMALITWIVMQCASTTHEH